MDRYTIHHTDAAKLYIAEAYDMLEKAKKELKNARTKDMLPKKVATEMLSELEQLQIDLESMHGEI